MFDSYGDHPPRDHHGDPSSDRWVNGTTDPEWFRPDPSARHYQPPPLEVQRTIDGLDGAVRDEHRRRLAVLDRILEIDHEVLLTEGAPTLVEWLTMRYRWTRFTATEMVRVAGALTELPAIRAAYADGVISWDQLRRVTRFATADTDADLARHIVGLPCTQIDELRQPATDEAAEEEAFSDRSARWWFMTDRHAFRLDATLPNAEGAIVATALERYLHRQGLDPTTLEFPDPDRTLADAIVDMASRYLGADSDPDRATILITTDPSTLIDRNGRPARIQHGPLVTNPTLRRLACDARLQLALADPDGAVVGVGRTTRVIPPWLARLVRSRDRGCRFPRCDRRRFVHVHHLVHWADGGPTELDNLVTLCRFHHRMVHNEGWGISGDPNHEITFVRPDGRHYVYAEDHYPGIETIWWLQKSWQPTIDPPPSPPDQRRT